MSQPERDKNHYHHGDLERALTIAAAELIGEEGLTGFSLAKTARRAGVSSAAPYRHFRDKEDLLRAVTHLAYYELAIRCEAAIASLPEGSNERIYTLGETYVTFMLEHAAFYELMWGTAHQQHWGEDGLNNPCAHTFHLLLNTVIQWCEQNRIASDTPMNIALRMWASTQGLATLSIGGHLHRFQADTSPLALYRSNCEVMLAGLLQTG